MIRRPRNLLFAGVAVALSLACYLLSMPPYGLWPLGFVALAPWMVYVLRARRRDALRASYVLGFLVFVVLVNWLRYVTIAGWLALAAYLAVYFLIFAMLLRWLRARLRLPVALLAPVLWMTLEYVRSVLFSGFPWFLIAHSQYNDLPFIQIADVVGTFGVGFVVMMVNGVLLDVILAHRGRLTWGVATAAAVALTFGYGAGRLAAYHPQPGPRVALIQGNVPVRLDMPQTPEDRFTYLDRELRLSLRPECEGADLIIWPETMVQGPLDIGWRLDALRQYLDKGWVKENDEYFRRVREGLTRVADETGARLLIGALGIDLNKPVDGFYNSVHYFDSGARYLGRYDKIHLVFFGEYTPLGRLVPALKKLRPAAMGPDVAFGRRYAKFDLPWHGRDLKFAVNICYEDTEPRVTRRLSQGVDFLVNVSNDAWFRGSAELEQHLAVGRFRCVENRVPMARAYNSGISSIVDATGRVTAVLEKDGKRREVEGVLTGRLPLAQTWSLYRAVGDVFAWLGCGAAVLFCGVAVRRGRRRKARLGKARKRRKTARR